MHSLVVGFGLGFLVALQLGPMSLFLIRSTLRRGWAVGLAIGAGIAVIDGLYAAGNTSSPVMGHTYAGPGATIGPAMVFGYLAALDIATNAQSTRATEEKAG